MEKMIDYKIVIYYNEYGEFRCFFRKAKNLVELKNNFANEFISGYLDASYLDNARSVIYWKEV